MIECAKWRFRGLAHAAACQPSPLISAALQEYLALAGLHV